LLFSTYSHLFVRVFVRAYTVRATFIAHGVPSTNKKVKIYNGQFNYTSNELSKAYKRKIETKLRLKWEIWYLQNTRFVKKRPLGFPKGKLMDTIQKLQSENK